MSTDVRTLLLRREYMDRLGVTVYEKAGTARFVDSQHRSRVEARLRPNACYLAAAQHALYLRSVYASCDALQALGCHPPPCMLLKIRLIVDSSPTSGAIRSGTYKLPQKLSPTKRRPAFFGNRGFCALA